MSLFIWGGGCGVKGRPLPPEYPPYIGRGMIEESSHPEVTKTPLPETPQETEEKKTEPQSNVTVPSTESKGDTGKSEKNPASKKNKEKRK